MVFFQSVSTTKLLTGVSQQICSLQRTRDGFIRKCQCNRIYNRLLKWTTTNCNNEMVFSLKCSRGIKS